MTNGKGSKSRVRDTKRFRENFDAIDWREKRVKSVKTHFDYLLAEIPRGVFPTQYK